MARGACGYRRRTLWVTRITVSTAGENLDAKVEHASFVVTATAAEAGTERTGKIIQLKTASVKELIEITTVVCNGLKSSYDQASKDSRPQLNTTTMTFLFNTYILLFASFSFCSKSSVPFLNISARHNVGKSFGFYCSNSLKLRPQFNMVPNFI